MREPLVRGGGARRGVRLAGPPPPTGYQCLSYALTRFFSGFSRVWFGLRGCSGSKSADAGLGTGCSSWFENLRIFLVGGRRQPTQVGMVLALVVLELLVLEL